MRYSSPPTLAHIFKSHGKLSELEILLLVPHMTFAVINSLKGKKQCMLVEKTLFAKKCASPHTIQHLIMNQDLGSNSVFLKVSDSREDTINNSLVPTQKLQERMLMTLSQ